MSQLDKDLEQLDKLNREDRTKKKNFRIVKVCGNLEGNNMTYPGKLYREI